VIGNDNVLILGLALRNTLFLFGLLGTYNFFREKNTLQMTAEHPTQ
jgi:hypothetical protein